jgi:asparagine synthase (glutamine-hydrolysing)
MFAGAFSWRGTGAIDAAVSQLPVERAAGAGALDAHLLVGGSGFVVSSEHLGAGPPRSGLWLDRCPHTGALVAFWGRLHDLPGLARRYGGPAQRTPAQWALEAWRHEGAGAPAALLGDYAFALIEPAARRALFARDAFGTRPLYWRRDGQAVLFATHLESLRKLARRQASADPRWMALYLANAPRAPESAPLVGVHKVAPGHSVMLDDALAPSAVRWLAWRDDAPWTGRRDPQWVESYRERLLEAVRVRLGTVRPVAVESSGGLDSSAIVGAVATLLPDPSTQVLCLGHALADREGGCIVDMSRLHGIGSTWISTAWRAVSGEAQLDTALRALGQPEEAATTTQFGDFPAECVRHGAQVLMSGFGGDEAASQWGDAVRHEARERRAWRALFDVTPGQGPMRLGRFVRDVVRGTPVRPTSASFELVAGLLLDDEWQRAVDVQQALASERARWSARRANAAVLAQLGGAQLSPRLEDGSLLAAAHGVEMAWPLLDTRLVQQVLSTPALERFGPRGMPRYLHRRAIEPWVPRPIAAQRNKDMGYASLMARLQRGEPLRQLIDAGRALDAQLHPAAVGLVDRGRLRVGLAAAEAGTLQGLPLVVFRRQVLRLRWLDRWLKLQAGPP